MKMGPFVLEKITNTRVFCFALFLAIHVGRARAQEQGFSVQSVVGPAFVERGHNFSLTCVYDMGECRLFKVTWKFNGTDFFLYDPEDGGASQDATVLVDVDASNATTVVITRARLRDAGEYHCEVTTEGDEYYISGASAGLRVGVVPKKPPSIEPVGAEQQQGGQGAELEKTAGDRVYFACKSAPSYPASTLTWTLNGKAVTEGLVPFDSTRVSDGTFTSMLGLNLTLAAQHFQRGVVQLRCQSALEHVKLESPPLRLVDPSYEESASSSSSASFLPKARWGMTALQLTLQVAVVVVAELLF